MQILLQELQQPYAVILAGGFYEWLNFFLRDLTTKRFIVTGTGETEMTFTSVADIAGFTAHVLTSKPFATGTWLMIRSTGGGTAWTSLPHPG